MMQISRDGVPREVPLEPEDLFGFITHKLAHRLKIPPRKITPQKQETATIYLLRREFTAVVSMCRNHPNFVQETLGVVAEPVDSDACVEVFEQHMRWIQAVFHPALRAEKPTPRQELLQRLNEGDLDERLREGLLGYVPEDMAKDFAHVLAVGDEWGLRAAGEKVELRERRKVRDEAKGEVEALLDIVCHLTDDLSIDCDDLFFVGRDGNIRGNKNKLPKAIGLKEVFSTDRSLHARVRDSDGLKVEDGLADGNQLPSSSRREADPQEVEEERERQNLRRELLDLLNRQDLDEVDRRDWEMITQGIDSRRVRARRIGIDEAALRRREKSRGGKLLRELPDRLRNTVLEILRD